MRKKGVFLILASVLATIVLFVLSKSSPALLVQKPFLTTSQIGALLGMIFFSYTFFLASRFSFLENIFGGLDKVYKLHQITGRLSFILIISHFIFLAFNYLGNPIMLKLLLLPGNNFSYNLGIVALWLMCLILTAALYLPVEYQWFVRIQRFFIVPYTLGVWHMLITPSDFSRFLPLAIFLLLHVAVGYLSWIYRVILYPFLGPRFEYKVEYIGVFPNDIIAVSLLPEGQKMPFLPGQFTYVRFDSLGIKKEFHPFSIASSPYEDRIRLAIKASGDFTTQVKLVKIGAKVTLMGPYGKFSEHFLRKNDAVCIAGGIGITPFLGMINYFKDKQEKNIHLFYTVKNESDNIFRQELERISSLRQNLSLNFINTETDGRLNAGMIQNTLGELGEKLFFLCGPKKMMEDISAQLKKLKIPGKNIIFEDFSLQ